MTADTEKLYGAAVHAFGDRGVVDLTYLIGIYHITCGLLNSFDIPAPG
jgi:4-carboxymuconolactone decarboxylase